MRNMIRIALAGTVACAIGCTKSGEQTQKIDGNQIVASNATPAEKAETLARSGEELFIANPAAFHYADEIFKMALAQDRNNDRAKFYRALIAPLTAMKGIMTRIKPLAAVSEKAQAEYDYAMSEIRRTVPDALVEYLLDGREDIKNEKDVQRFADSVIAAYDSLRRYHKENKNKELTVYLPQTYAWAQLAEKAGYKDCSAKEVEPGVYEYVPCTKGQLVEARFVRGDHEGAQHIAAAMQVYGILMNSRDLTGAIDVSVQAQDQKLSNEAIYQALAKEKDFSMVRNSSGLRSIIDMGVDAIAGVRAALAAKAELCPDVVEDVYEEGEYGWEAKRFRKRPGYVFAKGVCIQEIVNGDPIEQVLANVELALRGQTLMKEFVERDGTRHEFEVKPAVAFTEPIQDLKVLEPKFDRCGTGVVEVADGSLGGLIVTGDINVVLRDKDIYSQFPEAECAR